MVEGADAHLLGGIAAGDEAALEQAYERYAAEIFASARRKLCNARLAEDVVQHVFIALWDHPERFDPARGSLRGYLLMLANCHSIDLIRSESARRHRETIDGMAVAETEDDPQALFLGAQEVDNLRRAIDLLSEREREAIELAFFQGYTYREVAILLDQPEGTVKSRIRLGLNRLRSALVE
ncbi:MAG: sigma-70 family RNA polymerase sigma factor [Actinomycetota bacterium]|nr:sigma-70 family RNA polymerase sigma factor [Actinomycetota bacterium]